RPRVMTPRDTAVPAPRRASQPKQAQFCAVFGTRRHARPASLRSRIARVALIVVLAAVVVAPAAAQDRMWMGFHDDPVLRYGANRQAELDKVKQNNATIVRTLVNWDLVAPSRPANAANPFDPAYRFNDLDEFVRNAQVRGLEVLMTIWGTPGWANGGKAV